MTTVTTDDNIDTTDLVYTQFSSTAVEPSASHVDSLPPSEEFFPPVYKQVDQKLIAASETTENIAEIPVVQEHVIVQEILQVSIVEQIQEQIVASAPEAFGSFPPSDVFRARVQPNHQEQIVAQETTHNTFENPAVQEP